MKRLAVKRLALLVLPLLAALHSARADGLDALSADGWYTWRSQAAEATSAWCCVDASRDDVQKGCDLDDGRYGLVNCGGRVLQGGEVRLYAKIEAGVVAELKVLSPDCPVYSATGVSDLGTIDVGDTSGWLRGLMREHGRADVRGDAAFVLAQTGADGSEQAIMQAMVEDPDDDVREEAVFALSQLPGERAVDALLAVVENRRLDLERRKNALFWLVQSESDRAFTSVERLLGQAPRR